VIAAGFPTKLGHFDYLESCRVPKFFLHSTNDIHGPKPDLEKAFEKFAKPKSLQFIEAADHFFAGSLDALESAVVALAFPVTL
jgi:hypothetical protein